MMQSLIAGGLVAAWSEGRNAMAAAAADSHYHPNRSGLYEVDPREYHTLNFPLQYRGKLIKVMCWGCDNLAVHDYRVVMMLRDPEEIRQSYEAFFGRPLKDVWVAQYAERMRSLETRLRNRRDVQSVNLVQYRDLVTDPLRVLAGLEWPISVPAAAGAIRPSEYRFRRELLAEGI